MAAKHKNLTDNIYESFKNSLEIGDFKLEKEQQNNIKKLSKDLSDSIVKFIQDQTFNITEMKAILELETMNTSGPYKADVLPQVKVIPGQQVATAVNTNVNGSSVSGGPVVGTGSGKGDGRTKTKGVLEGMKQGILIPKVNFRKKKGQGGTLKTKGYAYVGANPVGSSSPRSQKVKLIKVKNK